MDNNQQSNGCINWRSLAIALGCVNIIESIGLGLFFVILFGFYTGLLHVAIGILVIYGEYKRDLLIVNWSLMTF